MKRQRTRATRAAGIVIALLAVSMLAGCRNHMVTIRLINTSAEPLSTIIVDYPSATFGKDKLAPGETFSSSVKFIDTDKLKVQFTDAKGANHTFTGPVMPQDAQGSVDLKFDQNSVTVYPNLSTR
ncbi:MAG TPA: hypothetical protein VFP71_09690 [Candidatus Angelobacter sp.]|nr:hypothetical protein [Candidatus Angelobacter sp.]